MEGNIEIEKYHLTIPDGSVIKHLPVMQKTCVQSLRWEDPLEEEMTTLQYSCLGSPMDRGSWQATVHGVAKRHD